MDLAALLPQFGGLIWTILAFLVALSVIVAIHEYGHYIVGRWSGIHAEVFSIGFGPVIASRVDRRGTQWQIAALPLGGYVKFKGDEDAASGKDSAFMAELTPEERRSTMHGAPLWARTLTVAAGPVFNFALSILIFASFALVSGVARDPLTVGTIHPLNPEQVQELRPGDEVLEIAGLSVPPLADRDAFDALEAALPKQPELDYLVRRAGQEQQVRGPYLYAPVIQGLTPQSAAIASGLAVGDVILAVDGAPVYNFDQVREVVESSDGRAVLLTVLRDQVEMEFTLSAKLRDEPQEDGGFETNFRLGIAGGMFFDPAPSQAGLGEALWIGMSRTYSVISGSINGLTHMITGAISTCNMSGPIGIAQVSGQMADLGTRNFILFIAVLSAAVGLLNLFPIPALDGGHLVFYAYEAITGRAPSDRALQMLMTLGIGLVLSLMVFALYNDIVCP